MVSNQHKWQTVKLGEVLTVLTDYHANGSYKKLKTNVELLDTPDYAVMIRTTNFEKRDFEQDLKYIKKSAYEFLHKSVVKPGDILMNKIANAGSVYYVPNLHRPVSLAMNLFLLRTLENKTNQQFIYYYLKSNESYIKQYAIGTAAKTITKESVRNLKISLPPLPTQNKIASIISAYDRLIENNTRRIKILESMAQTIYQEWFVKFRFPGCDRVKMVESELGLIPEGWKVKELGDVVTEIIDYRGKTPKKLGSDWSDSGIIAISAKNIKQGKLVNLEKSKFVDEQLYKKWMKSELQQGDILMTSEAPLGELYYLVEFKKFCLSQRVYGIKANSEIIKPDILYCSLGSNVIQEQLYARRSGTTVLGIRQTELRKVFVFVPPMNIQISASRILNDLFLSVENLQQKNNNLRKTRDLLLPKLISGQIDLENLDIDTGELAA